MPNVSDKKKVELLENAILYGTTDDVIKTLQEYAPFEFAARALGLCCVYGGYEKTKVLLAAGCSFAFEYTPQLKSKYGAAYVSGVGTVYPAEYYLLLADTGVNVEIPMLYTDSRHLHFGDLPRWDVQPVSLNEQIETVKLLCTSSCAGFDARKLLYYSVLWDNKSLTKVLNDLDVTLPVKEIKNVEYIEGTVEKIIWNPCYTALTEAAQSLTRSELYEVLLHTEPQTGLDILTEFNLQLQRLGVDAKSLLFTQKIFEVPGTPFASDAVLSFVVKRTDVSKLKKNALLEIAVLHDAVGALASMAELGWIKTPKICDGLINLASKDGITDTLAWLMDYKSRTADIKAEQEKKEEKEKKELSRNPASLTELKKLWMLKKAEDGTWIIGGYKGEETKLEIPAEIGGIAVTAIASRAFSPTKSKAMKETYEKIEEIIIPDTVTDIGLSTFYACIGLRKVVISASLPEIREPDRWTPSLSDGVFSDCSNLEEVIFRSADTKIDKMTFRRCRKLTIYAPKDSNAEKFAALYNIPFTTT